MRRSSTLVSLRSPTLAGKKRIDQPGRLRRQGKAIKASASASRGSPLTGSTAAVVVWGATTVADPIVAVEETSVTDSVAAVAGPSVAETTAAAAGPSVAGTA